MRAVVESGFSFRLASAPWAVASHSVRACRMYWSLRTSIVSRCRRFSTGAIICGLRIRVWTATRQKRAVGAGGRSAFNRALTSTASTRCGGKTVAMLAVSAISRELAPTYQLVPRFKAGEREGK